MPVRVIESKQNARLQELRRGFAATGRHVRDHVGIEGGKLLQEALRAGLHVTSVFVARGWERVLDPLALPNNMEILSLPRALLASALATESPQPIAALIEQPEWSWADVLGARRSAALVVVLAGIQDPGNLGTILRSAEAFGASGVVSLPGCASAWNPKAVRASAGSVFRVPVLAASAEECFEKLHEGRLEVFATAVRGAKAANAANLGGAVAILIGNEGNGVPEDIASMADGAITIPCPGPVESLNAAVAASVLLYEAARQRTAPSSHPFSAATVRAKQKMEPRGRNRGARR
jgi:RNA methyltransferase, TrmH family